MPTMSTPEPYPSPYPKPTMSTPEPYPGTTTYTPPTRPDFSWYEGGVQKSTAGWSPTQWQQYYTDHPDDPYAPKAGGTAAPAAPGAAPAAPPITSMSQVLGGTAPSGGAITPGAPSSVAESFQQALINRLSPGALTPDNPAIKGAIDANRLAEQRGLEGTSNFLAERNAANGTNMSGGFESQLLGAQQDSAARKAAYEADAVRGLQQQQDADLTGALGLAGGLLSGSASLDQAKTLAELQAAIQREQIAQQGSLGSQDIALRSRLGEGQLNLGLLSALLQNSQFGRQLEQQGSQFGASLDQSGILGLLGLLG